MKVKCTAKPGKEFTHDDVTVGLEYEVIKYDWHDYFLIDDTGGRWYYWVGNFTVIKDNKSLLEL